MPPVAERMSRVDTSWLRMDNDVNLMMIVGVWLLTPGVAVQAVRERIADKLLKYDRFRRKVVHDAVGAQWVEDEAFDIEHHVTLAALEIKPGQTERQALQHLCGDLAATPYSARRCIVWVRIWISTGLPCGPMTVVCRDWYMLNFGIAM